MIKADLTNKISQELNIPKQEAEEGVNLFFETIREAILRGEEIEIRSLGCYDLALGLVDEPVDEPVLFVRMPEPGRIRAFRAGEHLMDVRLFLNGHGFLRIGSSSNRKNHVIF